MYLSDVDLREAVACGALIVNPLPDKEIGPTSIDLHLGSIDDALVWDLDALAKMNEAYGHKPRELNIARMAYNFIAEEYLVKPPREAEATNETLVFCREDAVVLRPHGFVLWQTQEIVGTPC